MRMCNAENQKRSAKGSNFKEDGKGFAPLEVITLCQEHKSKETLVEEDFP